MAEKKPIALYDGVLEEIRSGDTINGLGSTFETVSKNLKDYPSVLNYTGENITSVVYDLGGGFITKTFNYTGENITSIVLSGDTPVGINLTKTLSYVGDNLTNITYSQ